jgi:acyl carrier protein
MELPSVTSVSPAQVEETIKEILATELELDLRPYGASTADTPLLGQGIGLDSIDALTLVTAGENRFDIEVGDDDLTVDLFKTVGTLAEYVARKASREAAPTRLNVPGKS